VATRPETEIKQVKLGTRYQSGTVGEKMTEGKGLGRTEKTSHNGEGNAT